MAKTWGVWARSEGAQIRPKLEQCSDLRGSTSPNFGMGLFKNVIKKKNGSSHI